MSEILLQTIVEKLESLEIALLKESDSSKDVILQNQILQGLKDLKSEARTFTSQLNSNNEKLNGFSKEMNLLRLNPVNLLPGHVKHIHHFHKLVWVTVSLFITSFLLAYGRINCHNEKKAFEANDLKYRYWKSDSNVSLSKLTYYTDNLYDMDKESFKKQVISAEQQIVEQDKQFRLADEKEKERRELKPKGQKSPVK